MMCSFFSPSLAPFLLPVSSSAGWRCPTASETGLGAGEVGRSRGRGPEARPGWLPHSLSEAPVLVLRMPGADHWDGYH